MLLKLVQSIQKSGEGSTVKEHPRRNVTRPARPRPRSGYELASGKDVASAMKKRWSGVQLNSKLSKAFDQLGDDSEYTDSLDGPRKSSSASKRLQISDDTSQDSSATWGRESGDAPIREHKKNILSSLNRRGAPEQPSTGGQKFKRLQQRWEQLSGRTGRFYLFSGSRMRIGFFCLDSSVSPLSSPEHKPREKDRTEGTCDTTPVLGTPSPTTRQSRIPRLVTSPVRPTSAPFSVCAPKPSGCYFKKKMN